MWPTLFTIDGADGPWAVPSYFVTMGLALILSWLMSGLACRKQRIGRLQLLVLLLASSLGGLLGARLGYAVLHASDTLQQPDRFCTLQPVGLALDGGLLASAAIGWWYCRLARLDARRLADALVPAVAFSIAVLRFGCFLQGCCYGSETSLPWGVVFPLHETAAASPWLAMFGWRLAPRHPVQLYEALGSLMIGAVYLRRRERPLAAGQVAAVATGVFFALRLVSDCFRATETLALPWTPLVHVLLAVISCGYAWRGCWARTSGRWRGGRAASKPCR